MCYNKVLKVKKTLERVFLMKTLIKALSFVLCIVMMLSLVSCNKDAPDDVPEGMKIATVPGHDFRLFVPTSWNANTAYGISGAYATLTTLSNVSVVKYPVSAETEAQLTNKNVASKERLDWFYLNECLPTVQKITVAGSLTEVVAQNATDEEKEAAATAMLGGEQARRHLQKGKVGESEIYFLHVLTERKINGEGNAFYVLEFVCDAQLYDRLIADVNKMIEKFIFDAPYQPDNYLKTVDETAPAPEGMKLASNGEVAYEFYVPVSWEVNRDERIFSASVKEDGKVQATVSVIPYMPDGANMSAPELFAMTESLMKATAGDGYRKLAEDDQRLVNGKRAMTYRYVYTVGGVEYEYMQVIVVHRSMLYSITYTARPEHFEAHVAEVEQIIGALVFR